MSGEISGQGGNQKTPRKDPDQDVQPWLGWVAAVLVVLIIVVAFALGAERFNQGADQAGGGITPLVGGMAVATATQGQEDDDGTAATANSSGGVTETDAIRGTAVTAGAAATATLTTTGENAISGTETMTATGSVTVTSAVTATGTTDSQAGTPTPEPEPTPTLTGEPMVFSRGDVVVSQEGNVTIYATADTASPVFDTVGSGVPLTVVEPSTDFSPYPVIQRGANWVRVRSADGLVGWVIADPLTYQP